MWPGAKNERGKENIHELNRMKGASFRTQNKLGKNKKSNNVILGSYEKC